MNLFGLLLQGAWHVLLAGLILGYVMIGLAILGIILAIVLVLVFVPSIRSSTGLFIPFI